MIREIDILENIAAPQVKRPYSVINEIRNYEMSDDDWAWAHEGDSDAQREVLMAESFRHNPEDAFLVLIEASPDDLPKLLMKCLKASITDDERERLNSELFKMILEANRAAYKKLSDNYIYSQFKKSHPRAA